MHDARTIIELTSDIISKNGNMLLNVELMGDRTIAILDLGLDSVQHPEKVLSVRILGGSGKVVFKDGRTFGIEYSPTAPYTVVFEQKGAI